MKVSCFVAMLAFAVPAAAAQARGAHPQSTTTLSPVAQAYDEFLLGHHLEQTDDVDGAIAAYKKAMELAPTAAEIPAELAALYWRQERADEAIASAQQALSIDAANREANRVLGLIYASRVQTTGGRQGGPRTPDENVTKAIRYLEAAIANPVGEADPNARATLARLYMRTRAFNKAIPLLNDLVKQQPGWAEGPALLAQAYAATGRTKDAIDWLTEQSADDPSLLPTLADFYERAERWKDAADTYRQALQFAPRNAELLMRYASALLNEGGRAQAATARDALTLVAAANPDDARTLYLLSQASRRAGDLAGAESAARRVIAAQGDSPWGYYALAEVLEEQRQYQQVVDALTPAVAKIRGLSGDHTADLAMLLPHLGFAEEQLGQYVQAIATFQEARQLAPMDVSVTGYLIDAMTSAKRYSDAIGLARQAQTEHPDDLRFPRLEAEALKEDGKADQGVKVLEAALQAHADRPEAYVALAQMYADLARAPQAVMLLQNAQAKFPADNDIAFELGAVLDKAKRFADAEAAFRSVIARDPQNAPALNYLGYMLAERGERLDESVDLLKKALAIEPDNGSYLDSMGWAYFKQDKLDLAEQNLRRAADQLKTNSVIQEHYGEVLFKLGRYDEAVAAWNRALAGDGEDIDRRDIDKKIRAAKQKMKK